MGRKESDITEPLTTFTFLQVVQSRLTLCDSWIVARQAPLSMGFPKQEHWTGCHFLLQGIFLTQGLNLSLKHLLCWRAESSPLSHLENPVKGSITFKYEREEAC